MPPRLLLLLPSHTYGAAAFVAAARRLGIALTVGTDQANVFGTAQPEGLIALDFARPERSREQVRAFAERHPVAAVFGVDDDTAVLAAHVASGLGLPHNSVAACLAARDKHRQRALLAGAGLPVPAFALHRLDGDLGAAARAAPYPCVIKPTRLSMSRGVMRANDPVAFLRAVERLGAILAQPDAARSCGEAADVFLVEGFVPGREIALEGLLDGGTLHPLALFDKPDPLDGPFFEETIYATPSDLDAVTQDAVIACVGRAARALGLARGPVHAEVRVNEQGVWPIELAARPIGGRCGAVLRFGDHGQVSLEQLLLAHALGLTLDGQRPIADEAGWLSAVRREPPASAVMMIPVPRAGTLRRITGVDEARRVPWIDDVVISAHPGESLVPLPEGSRYLGFIFARADHAATAVAAVREAHGMLAIELE